MFVDPEYQDQAHVISRGYVEAADKHTQSVDVSQITVMWYDIEPRSRNNDAHLGIAAKEKRKRRLQECKLRILQFEFSKPCEQA